MINFIQYRVPFIPIENENYVANDKINHFENRIDA